MMYRKSRKIKLLLSMGFFLAPLVAFPDRLPLLDEDLTDQANIVLIGKVMNVKAKQKEGPATATIEVLEILKGKKVDGEIQLAFQISEGNKYPRSGQLRKNEKYSLFLKRSARGYTLVNQFDAARKLTPEEEKKTRNLVKSDAKYDALFKHIKVILTVEKTELKQGEKVKLTFSIVNNGKENFTINGAVVNAKGQLQMQGWMRLIYEKLKGKKAPEMRYLGGSHNWKTPDIIIPPGATRKWDAVFEWGSDYGQLPGEYRLRWKFGKVVSNPVTFRVLERVK
ncbi:MAG: hypothetical protein HRT89_03020 [Lentisphaeria bacterium]|nr:hypothetical protein [Lentisphaeria bacterium]NQZ67021.1 hypothetical protein [Lentisphaeria bacterium]